MCISVHVCTYKAPIEKVLSKAYWGFMKPQGALYVHTCTDMHISVFSPINNRVLYKVAIDIGFYETSIDKKPLYSRSFLKPLREGAIQST